MLQKQHHAAKVTLADFLVKRFLNDGGAEVRAAGSQW
jgi:hypothetical protein